MRSLPGSATPIVLEPLSPTPWPQTAETSSFGFGKSHQSQSLTGLNNNSCTKPLDEDAPSILVLELRTPADLTWDPLRGPRPSSLDYDTCSKEGHDAEDKC